MCTRYISPDDADIERHWHIGARNQPQWQREVFPNYLGPFIRSVRAATEPSSELVVGQWSLIPWFAKERKLKYPTSNARAEELQAKASYKHPWARGQRCIIPADAYFEPCWETGKHVPWMFRRADGDPWGLAGLWNTWTDPTTGELVESYTMLTLNADNHPLMKRMHKPDPKQPLHMQDKRSVVPIEAGDVDTWLNGTVGDAAMLVRVAPVERFDAGPAEPPAASTRPAPAR